MGRFLFAVVVLALAWWGYESFYLTEASASRVDLAGLPVEGSSEGLEVLAEGSSGAGSSDGAGLEIEAKQVPLSGASDLIDRLAKGEAEAYALAFTELAAMDASRRGRLATVLLDLDRRRSSVEDGIRLLGRNNAFLRTGEGLNVARSVLRSAFEAEPEDAIGWSSRLLSLCMKGALDDAGRTFVWDAYAQHLGLVNQLEFNPASAANARQCTVKSGDSLARIAKRYRKSKIVVESGTLQLINRIKNPNAIRVGQRLRIPLGEIRTLVEKKSYLLAVYIGENLVRLYPCAHGKVESPTPVTTFQILDKIPKPIWYRQGQPVAYGDPENPLGTHFVKFVPQAGLSGFGIHGTWKPQSIGTMASMGCVRLSNTDVLEYYTFIPRTSKVEIRASE